MANSLTEFYLNQKEPNKSCYLALRDIILSIDENITPEWKYKLPFFYYKGKMMCYLWKDKKTNQPYLSFMEGKDIEHTLLEQGDRKRAKILRINPEKDLPKDVVEELVFKSMELINKKIK